MSPAVLAAVVSGVITQILMDVALNRTHTVVRPAGTSVMDRLQCGVMPHAVTCCARRSWLSSCRQHMICSWATIQPAMRAAGSCTECTVSVNGRWNGLRKTHEECVAGHVPFWLCTCGHGKASGQTCVMCWVLVWDKWLFFCFGGSLVPDGGFVYSLERPALLCHPEGVSLLVLLASVPLMG